MITTCRFGGAFGVEIIFHIISSVLILVAFFVTLISTSTNSGNLYFNEEILVIENNKCYINKGLERSGFSSSKYSDTYVYYELNDNYYRVFNENKKIVEILNPEYNDILKRVNKKVLDCEIRYHI